MRSGTGSSPCCRNMDNFKLLDKEIAARGQWDGVYYGNHVQVLARTRTMLLLWVPGQSVWSGTGQAWRYAQAHMMIHRRGSSRYSRLCEGGRLKVRLHDCAAEIDEAFGDGFSKLLDPTKTVVA
jgi:hypothetical protein